jgi:hypothetical protein
MIADIGVEWIPPVDLKERIEEDTSELINLTGSISLQKMMQKL